MRSAPAFAFSSGRRRRRRRAARAGSLRRDSAAALHRGLALARAPFAGLRGGIAKTSLSCASASARAPPPRLDARDRLQCRVFRDGRDGRLGRNTPRFLTQEVTVQGSNGGFSGEHSAVEKTKDAIEGSDAPLFAYARASEALDRERRGRKKVSARQVEIPLRRLQPLPRMGKLKTRCANCASPCPAWQAEKRLAACNPCPHGKVKYRCADCNPCPHGKLKHNCEVCSGCEHGKLKYVCVACTSVRAERPNARVSRS